MRNIGIALVFGCLLSFAFDAHAQYQGGGGYYGGGEQPTQPAAGTDPAAGGGYYDPGAGSYGGPAYGAPPPQPQPPPPPPPTVSASTSTTDAGAENEFKGFELGINWAGGAKVAFQPGVMLGKFGIYLLLGMNLYTDQETATTDDSQLAAWDDPGGGADHHDGEGNYNEEVNIKSTIFTYDIGLALRFYLLEALKAQSPNLYLELDLGWRGAAVKNVIDWNYKGDLEAIGDVNADGSIDGDDAKDLEYDRNKTWNRYAEDAARDDAQKYDGLWMNLGIGGEYVFVGGFGIAGEVGFSLFWNTPWTEKAPFGYDDDPSLAEFDYEYEDVKYHGWGVDFGIYYNLALRYHF